MPRWRRSAYLPPRIPVFARPGSCQSHHHQRIGVPCHRCCRASVIIRRLVVRARPGVGLRARRRPPAFYSGRRRRGLPGLRPHGRPWACPSAVAFAVGRPLRLRRPWGRRPCPRAARPVSPRWAGGRQRALPSAPRPGPAWRSWRIVRGSGCRASVMARLGGGWRRVETPCRRSIPPPCGMVGRGTGGPGGEQTASSHPLRPLLAVFRGGGRGEHVPPGQNRLTGRKNGAGRSPPLRRKYSCTRRPSPLILFVRSPPLPPSVDTVLPVLGYCGRFSTLARSSAARRQ